MGSLFDLGAGAALRAWQPGDADTVLALYRDPDVSRWDPLLPMTDIEQARTWLELRRHLRADDPRASWAVTGDDGLVVGSVSLSHLDLAAAVFPPVSATISYHLLPSGRGRGLASRAAAAACRWALDERGLHRVELHHDVANTASCAVAARAGFTLEGTRRAAQPTRDGWADEHLHAWVADPADRR